MQLQPKGLSRNKIYVGVATDKKNTVTITEVFSKPSQRMSSEFFISHIPLESILVHDKEYITYQRAYTQKQGI